ncbi:methyl-accepting chemotaxis protein [Paenibacillus sp. NPDC057967]|uniref:methyl-accepting chemotaxis protein n=1 Tax=Paenibacillus sp. NPDC057967 TaxID=3346293 RepID=UPI0036D948BB
MLTKMEQDGSKSERNRDELKSGKPRNQELHKIASFNITRIWASVGFKLFIIIFVGILACVLTVGLISYSQAKQMVEENVSEASHQTIVQAADNLDVVFKTYEDFTMQLLVDKDFFALARNIAGHEDESVRYSSAKALSDKFRGYALSQQSVKGMILLPVKQGLHVVASGSSLSTKAEALKESDWYRKTLELNGKTHWIAPQAGGISYDSKTPTIGLSRLLKDGVSSDASYILLLEMDAATFSGRYASVELGEGSALAIVDREGKYVLAQDAALIGQAASISVPSDDGSWKGLTTDGSEVLAVYKTFQAMDWKLVGTIPVKALTQDAEAIRSLTWITALAAALIAVAIGGLVIMTIARPLVKLRNLMLQGADGNLAVRSSIRKRRDEIGGLSDSFNRMMGQMTELAQEATRSAEAVLATASRLSDASHKTSSAAKEIAVATEEIASGSSNLASEADRGSQLTGRIDAGMKQVLSASEMMLASAAQVERASEQGTAYMEQLLEKTGMTEAMTSSMAEKVDALKDSTASIAGILEVMQQLTKQTNILSLNAAIEAARAGTAGKGFMVVADEIRKLAEQSRQSIEIVARTTETIRHGIDETVQVLSQAYPIFQEQIGSVKEANGIFISVQQQMAQFVQGLDSVTGSVAELEHSQAALSEAMLSVSSVADQSSATSEEVASLSHEQLGISGSLVSLSGELNEVSTRLKESLAQFNMEKRA